MTKRFGITLSIWLDNTKMLYTYYIYISIFYLLLVNIIFLITLHIRCLIYQKSKMKQGPYGAEKLSFLISLNIKNPKPIPGIFTHVTIRNGFLIKF